MQRKWKNLLVLVFGMVALMIALSSCSSSSPENLIVGEWTSGGLIVVINDDGSMQFRERGRIERARWDMLGDNTLDIHIWSDSWLSYRYTETLAWSNSVEEWDVVIRQYDYLKWHVTRQYLYLGGMILTRR